MNKDKEIIDKQYKGCYYGFDIFSATTLGELNEIYNQVETSNLSPQIKGKVIAKIKIRIKYLRLPKDLKKKLSHLLNQNRNYGKYNTFY